jgi:hypothetical protein
MKNITLAVNKLIKVAQEKYGPGWRYKVRTALSGRDDYYDDFAPTDPKLRLMRKFFKSHGYDLLSCGAFRIVFGWKDVVFKIDCPSRDRFLKNIDGNIAEVESYNEMIKTIPRAKYFICPLLKTVKIKNSIVLVYPKVKVYGDEQFATTMAQDEMYSISGMMFDDLHAYNVGKFCNGLVAIDFNFGTDYSSDHNKDISHFVKQHKAFWKKYVAEFDKTLKSLKKEYAA